MYARNDVQTKATSLSHQKKNATFCRAVSLFKNTAYITDIQISSKGFPLSADGTFIIRIRHMPLHLIILCHSFDIKCHDIWQKLCMVTLTAWCTENVGATVIKSSVEGQFFDLTSDLYARYCHDCVFLSRKVLKEAAADDKEVIKTLSAA